MLNFLFSNFWTHHPEASDQFEAVFKITDIRSGFGFGFSKKIPKSLIDEFQTTLDDLIKDGSIEKILTKYHLR